MRLANPAMPYTVDFDTVSTVGLESSPVADALAGLRAHEARYFKTKYNQRDHLYRGGAGSGGCFGSGDTSARATSDEG